MRKLSILFFNLLLLMIFASQVLPQNKASKEVSGGGSGKTVGKTPVSVTGEKIEQDFAEALTVIEDNYIKGNHLDYNELFKSSIDSMLHTLDPHSNYFDAKETEAFRTDQSSQYFGIGVSIGEIRDSDGRTISTYIRATFDGTPAHRANLRYGDKVLEVNNVSMIGRPSAEVSTNLRGPRGTVAKVTVEHYGTGKRETVELVRDAVSQPSITEAYLIRPTIGYIAMTGGFHQTTFNEFTQALARLKSQGMQSLVLDLRDNGGGLVVQAYKVANAFLSDGQMVFTQKGRLAGTVNEFPAENSNPDKSPLVLLVNGNTASASEILAGGLQDHDRAFIVGETTFGKGLVQNPFQLDYGSMLLLTIAKYQTPSGRLIQRDYSNDTYYNYMTKGGSLAASSEPKSPFEAARKTDTGRVVYGGGGIVPDEIVKAQTISNARADQQFKLTDSIVAFALDLAFGKTAGFDNYKIDRSIVFNYDLKATDFPITDDLYQAFKKYAANKYKLAPAQIDREREFVERFLRTELVTAAYGTTTSRRIFNEQDNQIKKAIEVIPRARQLALESEKVKAQKIQAKITFEN